MQRMTTQVLRVKKKKAAALRTSLQNGHNHHVFSNQPHLWRWIKSRKHFLQHLPIHVVRTPSHGDGPENVLQLRKKTWSTSLGPFIFLWYTSKHLTQFIWAHLILQRRFARFSAQRTLVLISRDNNINTLSPQCLDNRRRKPNVRVE